MTAISELADGAPGPRARIGWALRDTLNRVKSVVRESGANMSRLAWVEPCPVSR
jgi:hypothetical protein